MVKIPLIAGQDEEALLGGQVPDPSLAGQLRPVVRPPRPGEEAGHPVADPRVRRQQMGAASAEAGQLCRGKARKDEDLVRPTGTSKQRILVHRTTSSQEVKKYRILCQSIQVQLKIFHDS